MIRLEASVEPVHPYGSCHLNQLHEANADMSLHL